MRILHSIRSANPAKGGPIEGVKQLGGMNIGAGHTVEVVCLDDPSDPWIKDFPMPIHALGPSRLDYGFNSRLVPWLKANHRNYDVVIINGLWQFNGFGVWLALKDTATPYCVFTHGMLDPWFKRHYPLKHLKKWLYWPWAEYRVLRDALAVMFTTEEERRLSRRSFWLYHCDEIVVSYGIRPPEGDPVAQRALFLEKFPHLADKTNILFLGRVHEKKGGDLLIEAFAQVLAKRPGAGTEAGPLHLVIAGPEDSDYGTLLKDMSRRLDIESHITWTGPVFGDLKWGAFAASSAFILPSHQENFGIAVAEALAMKVPVLISNRVNIWREVRMHDAGFVEADDLAGTTRLIESWVETSPETRTGMRENSVRCFDTCFNLDSFANSFVGILGKLGMPK